MNQSLSDALEPIAAAFRSVGTPEPIVTLGTSSHDGDRGFSYG
ncbi:unnamed protein product [Microcystis aeruginosa NIES-298]|uniref:Uncharacterized protein n=1 Tax=Microcystis aeruginosa NIES-4285 TaxID=2497681 RepID=A0A402DBB6_MICAE|nr:unnamed protein product [Microcystis aeruginosa NIES-298]GCE59516.1 hypothetical protein MiAbB_01434 [Microcystis aeruginosa NIES-4285]